VDGGAPGGPQVKRRKSRGEESRPGSSKAEVSGSSKDDSNVIDTDKSTPACREEGGGTLRPDPSPLLSEVPRSREFREVRIRDPV
jgi:hypothetical protein